MHAALCLTLSIVINIKIHVHCIQILSLQFSEDLTLEILWLQNEPGGLGLGSKAL